MADTDRTLPEIIDATVLLPDDVERRTAADVATNGRAVVLKRLSPWPPDSDAVKYAHHCGIDMGGDEGAVVLVVVGRELPGYMLERLRAEFDRMESSGVSRFASLLVGRGRRMAPEIADVLGLRGGHVDQIILDDPLEYGPPTDLYETARAVAMIDGVRDAYGLKVRDVDRGPDATQCALTPAKLTPSEARVARKLAGPWHDDKPWKHTKNGGRR